MNIIGVILDDDVIAAVPDRKIEVEIVWDDDQIPIVDVEINDAIPSGGEDEGVGTGSV